MNKLDNKTSEDNVKSTFSYAGKLPSVPLPGLIETADRFMEWCSPILTEEEQRQTKNSLASFVKPNGLGEKLQAALKSYNDQPGTLSWLDDFWPSRYLGRRDPIALNANFLFLFQHEDLTQSQRAAKIIAAALNYKLMLDQEKIAVAMSRKDPLCMDQMKYLFSSTRIPGEQQDTLRSFYSDAQPGPSTARHIIVMYKAKIYSLDVVSEAGIPHSMADIEAGITNLLEQGAQQPEEEFSVGHFTTMRRAEWASTRKDFKNISEQNNENMDLIETGLFAINLEETSPANNLEVSDQLLHGGPGNRWYDKALQLIIFKNGMAGINVEHCGLDGTTVLNFVDYILTRDLAILDESSGAESQGVPKFELLSFDLNPDLKNTIKKAAADFDKLRETTVTRTFDFKDWGAKHIKSLGMSPDAFAQCAMQLAHYRTKGFIGATYESIALRQYERGRTEAMRTITPQVFDFIATLTNETSSTKEKIEKFRTAGNKHVARAKECQQSKAPEQHLWEMLNIYNRNPENFKSGFFSRLFSNGLSEQDIAEALALYNSPGWIKMRSDALSTSSAPSPTIQYFGFGSTGPGCIGVGYLVRTDEINCYLSTAQGEEAALESFMVQYKVALQELSELLQQDNSG